MLWLLLPLVVPCMACPQEERLQDLMDKLRGRFKAVAAQIGLLQDYFPREAMPAITAGALPSGLSCLSQEGMGDRAPPEAAPLYQQVLHSWTCTAVPWPAVLRCARWLWACLCR